MDRFLQTLTVINVLVIICNVCSQELNPCDRGRVMVPNIPKRSGSNGYRIRIDGQPTGYVPGQQYRVLLQSTPPVSFREFFLVALREDNPAEGAGTFEILDRLTSELSRTCSPAVTHAIRSSKTSVSIRWTAPSSGSGCVNFKAGVIQKKTVWFADDDDLTLQLCEAQAVTTAITPGNLTDPDACCAPPYLEAKYKLTFVSTWTPDTHPKDYPRGRGNHWSDMIGASHSPAYTIWDYGMFATEGVRMVAEWGSPFTLEREIKLEGSNVKTVITSRGLFPAYDLTRNMTAVFKTDSEHNLVSLLTMMGPSPDWCVGITRENLCTPDCDWVERKEFSLQPWDAGTDAGITYDANNALLDPPERIRPITSSDPDNERAPFYNANGDPIPPLGRVYIERISVRNHSRRSQEPETDDGARPHGGESDGGMPPKVMGGDPTMPPKVMGVDPTMPSKVMPVTPLDIVREGTQSPTMPPKRQGRRPENCMMSEWGDWTECSKSCGKGKMMRQRMIKRRPRRGGQECGSTKEKKSCSLGRCARGRDCEMGPWSEWSECSVTCGEGIEFRMRDVARRSRGNGAPCGAPKEMRVCQAYVCE